MTPSRGGRPSPTRLPYMGGGRACCAMWGALASRSTVLLHSWPLACQWRRGYQIRRRRAVEFWAICWAGLYIRAGPSQCHHGFPLMIFLLALNWWVEWMRGLRIDFLAFSSVVFWTSTWMVGTGWVGVLPACQTSLKGTDRHINLQLFYSFVAHLLREQQNWKQRSLIFLDVCKSMAVKT